MLIRTYDQYNRFRSCESIDNFACFVLGLFSSILPRKIYIAFQRWVRLISASGLVIGLHLAGYMFQEEALNPNYSVWITNSRRIDQDFDELF